MLCFFFTALALLLAFCHWRFCRWARGKQYSDKLVQASGGTRQVVKFTAEKTSQTERQGFKRLTVAGLQNECGRQGVQRTGIRADLVARVRAESLRREG